MSKTIQSSRGLLIFGICWTAFSSIFVFVGIITWYDAYTRSAWPETACTVTRFEISAKPNNDPPFQPKVNYTYQWEGSNHTGDKVWADHTGEDKYEDLHDLIKKFENNEFVTCRVNPDDPAESVLIASPGDTWGSLPFTLFGLGFMTIGIGMIIWSRKQKNSTGSALSSKKTDDGNAPNFILIPVFGIFFLAGLGVLLFVIVPQWIKYNEAKGWVATPAKVIWSRVKSHSSDDGTTYSVDIFYSYEFNSKQYKSNTTGLMSGSSSGRSGKLEKVRANPPGKKITCYVNPEKPWQALLERDLGWWALFALFPLPFLAAGGWGLWWAIRKRGKSAKRNISENPFRSSSHTRHKEKSSRVPARRTLKPGGKRIGHLIGSLAFALIWNGITSVFVWQAVESWQRGKPEWFLTIFITPFVLIGIGAIVYVFYRLLALLNPSTTLTLTPGIISMDEPAKLKWNTSSGAHRFRHFAIYLVGEEEASYRRGTDTVTDTETFYEEALIDTQDPRKSITGSTRIELPSHTAKLMPSWKASNNRIRWRIHVKGDIAIWPDVSDRYEITVRPVDISS